MIRIRKMFLVMLFVIITVGLSNRQSWAVVPYPSTVESASESQVAEWQSKDITKRSVHMDSLTIFGLFSVTAMLVFYALEYQSHWFILAFALACVLGSIYGFLQGAWPFGLVEAVWSIIAARRWWIAAKGASKAKSEEQ